MSGPISRNSVHASFQGQLLPQGPPVHSAEIVPLPIWRPSSFQPIMQPALSKTQPVTQAEAQPLQQSNAARQFFNPADHRTSIPQLDASSSGSAAALAQALLTGGSGGLVWSPQPFPGEASTGRSGQMSYFEN